MANINQIGIPGLDNGFLQPKQMNKWRIAFIGTASSVVSSPTKLSMQAISCTRPTQTFDTIEIARFNARTTVPAKHTWEPITLVIEDDIKSKAAKIILNQMEKQQHFTGGSGAFLKRDISGGLYNFAMDIIMLNGGENVLEQWALEGCWFQSVSHGELDYSSSDTVKITITINYASARPIYYNVSGSDKAEGSYVFNIDNDAGATGRPLDRNNPVPNDPLTVVPIQTQSLAIQNQLILDYSGTGGLVVPNTGEALTYSTPPSNADTSRVLETTGLILNTNTLELTIPG